jgi:hypothetical protein
MSQPQFLLHLAPRVLLPWPWCFGVGVKLREKNWSFLGEYKRNRTLSGWQMSQVVKIFQHFLQRLLLHDQTSDNVSLSHWFTGTWSGPQPYSIWVWQEENRGKVGFDIRFYLCMLLFLQWVAGLSRGLSGRSVVLTTHPPSKRRGHEVELYLYSLSGPWPVIGRTFTFILYLLPYAFCLD